MSKDDREPLKPADLAARWRVKPHTILAWIKTGELPAANLARDLACRPRYRIRPEDAEEFWRRRMKTACTPTQRAKPRRKSDAQLLDWLGVDL